MFKFSPAFVLFLLAPAIGELLSGSSPPLEFFNPIVFLLLAALYGSGAVVMRELKVRWKKDYRALLLLGAAYGVLEEGLMVKSFFDPKWVDLGYLGTFGRWAEVNWVWTEMLIIYHAVFSITIPIVLVELAYPQKKDESWIGNRSLLGLVGLLVAVTAICFFFLTPYRPPMLHYLLTVLAMGLFIVVAYKFPEGKEEHLRLGNARLLFVLGLAVAAAFFLLSWVGPYIISNPIAIMLLEATLAFGMITFLSRFGWKGQETAFNRLAIISGALSFLIFLAFMQELNAARGMALVGLAAIVGIVLLRRKVKKAYIPPNV